MYQRILYTSRATDGITLRNVYDVIRVSHNRNSDSGLTGALLFLDGFFIQVLEGAPYAVDERYKRIAADDRHCELELRIKESTSELLFPSEWMALKDDSTIDRKMLSSQCYEPGMPSTRFNPQQVLDFLLSCFAPTTAM
ncbi:BLUF domain-containing protein [Rubripirellula reticaptiva]|uniref:Blue light-and temperature-regulated antirepressor YcgF n=1 Tax=Rubripirellula reticaptiva TaxID=2528013 RepID=A0A5C6FC30_9BACT|nr:BLUF domain-containing protein [Rubripirellula reticaptiva]TWU58167.1 Blue light- and temperature-regulated antirepressor YcgF [Rubripirellula reticaptiva]